MLRMLYLFIACLLMACNYTPRKKTVEEMVRKLPSFPVLLMDSSKTVCTNWLGRNKATIIVFFDPTCYNCQVELKNIFDSAQLLTTANIIITSESEISEIKKHILFPTSLPQGLYAGRDVDSVFTKVFQETSVPVTAFYNVQKRLMAIYRGNAPVKEILRQLHRINKMAKKETKTI